MKISEAELEVLKIIWEKEETTSFDIISKLESKNWNCNTIRTFIKRLLNKNAIAIIDKKGKTFIYKSNIDKEEYKFYKTKELLDVLFNGNLEELIKNYNIFNQK